MNSSNPKLSRRLLRPLLRRLAEPANDKVVREAIVEFEKRAIAESLLPQMAAQLDADGHQRGANRWRDPAEARERADLLRTLYLARRISLQEYVCYASHSVHNVHDERCANGYYPALQKLSDEMKEIEVHHGLMPDEFWRYSDAPIPWQKLSVRWDATYEKLLAQTFAELEGGEVTDLFIQQRNEFDRLNERGRRALFHRNELMLSLADTVKRYESEARAAAGVKAYTAAITLIGAALEGLLLLRCLRSPKKTAEVAQSLPAKKRPKAGNPPSTWTLDNLIQVCLAAGWLPSIEGPSMSIDPAKLADRLRKLRNNVHPGRVCTENPWIETELRDFEDAELIYSTLFARVFRGHLFKRLDERLG